MHTLQLKNKRGKVVAVLQWERPEDLINWANAMANENGKEFRNVDPEVPVILEAIAAPVHKLKIVAKEQTLSVKSHSDIQTLLQSISENLHEEFEILMCKKFVNENTLSEKKNQINILNEITEALESLHESEEKEKKYFFKIKLIPKKANAPIYGLKQLLLSGLKIKNTFSIKESIKNNGDDLCTGT